MYAANCVLMDTFLDYCVDCGNEDPLVLEFDHVHAERDLCVRNAAASSRTRMLTEIAKCEVRCANCHKKRHAEERLGAA